MTADERYPQFAKLGEQGARDMLLQWSPEGQSQARKYIMLKAQEREALETLKRDEAETNTRMEATKDRRLDIVAIIIAAIGSVIGLLTWLYPRN